MAKNSGSSENINFMTDQNTKLNREIVHSWWTYSLLAWSVNWVHEKSRVFKVNRTYISLTKCTRGSEMIQDSIQQNNFSSVPKSEKRKSWLLTTLQHFSEGLQRYLGSWCKSLFTQYSADSNLQKTPVDSVYVRHLVWRFKHSKLSRGAGVGRKNSWFSEFVVDGSYFPN